MMLRTWRISKVDQKLLTLSADCVVYYVFYVLHSTLSFVYCVHSFVYCVAGLDRALGVKQSVPDS